jgi:SpoIIAA-like
VIRELTDLPDGVVGFEGEGKLHADDYKNTLIPAIERLIAEKGAVRAVLVFPQFDGLSAGGTWQDLKMGVEHLTKMKRIALVTDVDWMTHVVHLFGWMTPGEVKTFALAERQAAIDWAAG